MRRRPFLLAVAAVAALALGTAACGSSTETFTINAVKEGNQPAGFAPRTITVDKSDEVKLKVGNQTTTQHGFSIEGYGVQEVVPPGQAIDVKFTAGKGGTYKIYCQLHPTHRPATLIVQ
jgi:nitrosocyanin